jgi:hypothetical protein
MNQDQKEYKNPNPLDSSYFKEKLLFFASVGVIAIVITYIVFNRD